MPPPLDEPPEPEDDEPPELEPPLGAAGAAAGAASAFGDELELESDDGVGALDFEPSPLDFFVDE